MKRLILAIGCWLCVASTMATNRLTLSTAEGSPGDTLTLTATLAATDAVVAAEVVIPLGDYIRYEAGSAILASARSNGHVLSTSQVGTELRVYLYSVALQPLRGESGELFTCRLILGDKPLTQVLVPQVVLSDASGNAIGCEITNGELTILAPEMTIQTPVIDYGHIPIRSTYTQPLRITNSGNMPLTVSEILFTDSEYSCDDLPVIIPAGVTQPLSIRYAPTRHGAVSSKLTVITNAVNGMYNAVRDVTLHADPFSVNELHVGNASGIADDTVSVPLTMNNMEAIPAGQVQFVLPKALRVVDGAFRLSSRATDHQAMLQQRGDTLTLYFFSPTNTPLTGENGELGTLRLRLDGTSGTYYLRPLNTVLANVAAVNMVSAVSNGYVTIRSPRLHAASSAQMGQVAVVDTSLASLTLTNNGNAPLVLERVTFLAEGYRCVTPLPLTIEQGRSATLSIQYTPRADGAFGTTMQLYTNDPDRRMYSVALTGKAYEPNSLTLCGQRAGKNYVLTVGLNNYSQVSALQFEFAGLPEAGVQLATTSRLAQHSAMLVPMGGGTYRVVVYSFANAAISGNSGAVLTITFPTANPMHINATVSNVVISSMLGQNVASGDAPTWQDELCEHIVTVQPDNSAAGKAEIHDAE